MALHPLTPAGIEDEMTLDRWQQACAQEEEIAALEKKRQEEGYGSVEAKNTSLIIADTKNRLRYTIDQLRKKMADNAEKKGGRDKWLTESGREKWLNEHIAILRENMLWFLDDQKTLATAKNAVMPDTVLNRLWAEMCLTPTPDTDRLIEDLKHPRAQLYIERHILHQRHSDLAEVSVVMEETAVPADIRNEMRYLGSSIAARDEYCRRLRAHELNVEPEDDQVAYDVIYEIREMDQWLQNKPGLGRLVQSIGIRFLDTFFRNSDAALPDLLRSDTKRKETLNIRRLTFGSREDIDVEME